MRRSLLSGGCVELSVTTIYSAYTTYAFTEERYGFPNLAKSCLDLVVVCRHGKGPRLLLALEFVENDLVFLSRSL